MTAMVLYCRPGFEKDCGAEFQEKAGWNNVFGYFETLKNKGIVIFHFQDAQAGEQIMSALPLKRLIFTRQWFISLTDKPLALPESNRVETIVESLGQEWQYVDLRMETPDTNDGKALSKFCRKLAVPLRQGLRKVAVLTDQPEAEGAILHALFLSGQQVWLGYSFSHNTSPHLMGIHRLKFPADAPSRSTLKLDEALLYFIPKHEHDTRVCAGLNAVDLGASPGGWTYQLVRRGMMVMAVDNGPMAESLLETGQVKHYQYDGFKFQPKKKNVYWLVCDMIEKPQRVAKLMAQWIIEERCKEAIFNLKLPMKGRYAQVSQDLQNIKDWFAEAGVRYEMYAKHLYYDREEVTVHIRRLN